MDGKSKEEKEMQQKIYGQPPQVRIKDGIFPEDIWVSILLRLPVKSLSRFKLVSKSWWELLSSSYFVQMHLRCSKTTEKLLRVCMSTLTYTPETTFMKLYNDPAADGDDFIVRSPFHFKPFDEVVLEDSCNGLVVLRIKSMSGIVLWNPATRKFRCIELPFEGDSPYAGLCYVAGINDYKMVRIPTLRERSCGLSSSGKTAPLWVYSLNSDSWKKLDVVFTYAPLQSGPPTLLNECMHWITDEGVGLKIAAFDAKNEVLQYMSLPLTEGLYIMRQLAIISESLSVVLCFDSREDSLVHEVWKMNEYGVQGSWSKQFVIPAFRLIALPVGSWKNGNLLFRYYNKNDEELFSYDPFTRVIQPFRLSRSFCLRVVNYRESLESVEGGRRRSSLGRIKVKIEGEISTVGRTSARDDSGNFPSGVVISGGLDNDKEGASKDKSVAKKIQGRKRIKLQQK